MQKLVENLKEIKTLYKIVRDREMALDAKGVFNSVNAIRYLEEITKQKFNSAKDLIEKMDAFLYAQEQLLIKGKE